MIAQIVMLGYCNFFILVVGGGPCSGFACCKTKVENPAYDRYGKAYGFENGQSCISLDNNGVLPQRNNDLPTDKTQTERDVSELKNVQTEKPVLSIIPEEKSTKPSESLSSERPTDLRNTATTSSKETPSSVTKIQTTTASKTVNTNMPTATVNGNRWNDKVYPYEFPSLPSPVAPWSYSCDSARTILANDIINCTFPLVNNLFNSPDKADLAAIDSVNCICTSSWKIGSQELDFILKSSCLPPGNLTKTNTFAIRDGCNINPYNYDSVIDSVGVVAHIINGDIYRPFSSNFALKEPHHAKILLVLFYLI